MKHTKGQWEVSRYDELGKGEEISYYILGDITMVVAKVICRTWPKILPEKDKEATANAKLIAAAPEMLEALKYVLTDCDLLSNQHKKEIERVIKKATE